MLLDIILCRQGKPVCNTTTAILYSLDIEGLVHRILLLDINLPYKPAKELRSALWCWCQWPLSRKHERQPSQWSHPGSGTPYYSSFGRRQIAFYSGKSLEINALNDNILPNILAFFIKNKIFLVFVNKYFNVMT